MTDSLEPKLTAENSETALLRALAKRLSNDEKMIRDHEVSEQANKYFGGLNRRERHLLGMDDSEEVTETVPVLHESGAGVWTRAILCALTFLGVFYWVIFTK